MKRYLALVFFCFVLSCSPLAFAVSSITSVPFNCTKPNETYIVTTDLTSTGTAITISASGVKIDGNGRRIMYAASTPGSGITFSSSSSNVEIFNLHLIEGNAGGPGLDTVYHSFTGLSVHDCTIICDTTATTAIKLTNFIGNVTNLLIYNNIISVQPTSGTYGNGIYITPGGAEISIIGKIYNNTITLGGTLSTSRPCCIGIGSISGQVDIDNNILSIKGIDDNNAIKLWSASGHTISNNSISMNCYHCRGILVDGGSNDNTIVGNSIDMNTTGSCSGLRVRYGSSNNRIFSNIIDSSDAQNDTFCIRHGERQSTTPSDYPSGNTYFENTLRGKSPLIYFSDGSQNTQFKCNKMTSSDGGMPIRFTVWNTTDPNAITDLNIFNNVIDTDSSMIAYISAQESQKSQFSNIVFCNSGVDQSRIYNPQSISGYLFDEASKCEDSCQFYTPVPDAPKSLKVFGSSG